MRVVMNTIDMKAPRGESPKEANHPQIKTLALKEAENKGRSREEKE